MRNKDENKKNSIFNAAIELITKTGFSDASMSKIAKAAGISAGTIYVYFDNKDDMINKLYLWIKEDSGINVLKGISSQLTVKENIKKFWFNTYYYCIKEPVKFFFGEQFVNSPFIKRINKEEGSKYYLPFIKILNKGKEHKILKNVHNKILSAYILAPLIFIIKQQLSNELEVDNEVLENAFLLAWDSIKKND